MLALMPGRTKWHSKTQISAESLLLLAQLLPNSPCNLNHIVAACWRFQAMKNLSILVPAAFAGVLVAATVFAAPASLSTKPSPAVAPDRAAAYAIATAE
jgi:hypothetical protein